MKKAISPVVVTALLLVVAVVAVLLFTKFMDSQGLLYEEPKPEPVEMDYAMFCKQLGYKYYHAEPDGFNTLRVCYNDLVNKTLDRKYITYLDYKLWAKSMCQNLNLTFYYNLGNGVCNK